MTERATGPTPEEIEMNPQDRPDWLSVAKTHSMETNELAMWFEVSERRITERLKEIDGAEKCGRRWRIPVCEMPIRYLLDVGLIIPQTIESDKLGQRPQQENESHIVSEN